MMKSESDSLIVVKGQTKKKPRFPSAISKLPLWLSSSEKINFESNFVSHYIRNDLVECEALFKNLNIKVHSVICSFVGELVNTKASASIKLTLLPLPAKTTIFRSVNISYKNFPMNSMYSSSSSRHSGSVTLTYDFALKSAILSMDAGDIRSHIFREGVCPLLFVEFSVAGYSASSSVYLPHLVSDYAGQSLHLNLACTSPQKKLFDRVSVILDINSAGSSSISHKAVDQSAAQTCFKLSVVGLTGAELKNTSNWKSDFSLSCCLASTGTSNEIDLSDGTKYRDIALDISRDIVLQSSRMRSDVIEIKLRNKASHSMDDMGAVYIPCAALVAMLDSHDSDAVDSAANPAMLAFDAWKWQSKSASSGSPPISIQNWQLICKFTRQSPDTAMTNTVRAGLIVPETADATTAIPTAEQETKVDEDTVSFADQENKVNEDIEEVVGAPILDKLLTVDYSLPKTRQQFISTAKVSISGSFAVCVQGFFGTKGSFSSKIMSQSNTIAVDVSIFPDGLKKRSTISSFIPAVCPDFEAFIEWNKVLQFSAPWSSHQVLYSLHFKNTC